VEVVPDKVVVRATPFADGLIRTDRWSLLRVTIANGGASTRATVSLDSRGMDEAGVQRYERTVELPRGARKDVVLDYRPGLGGTTRKAQITVGRDLMEVEFPVQLLAEGDVGVAVVGLDTLGVNAVAETWMGPVPGRWVRSHADGPRKVRIGLVPESAMPESPFGWDVVDWVVWPGADPATVEARQVEALRSWVADGGHLFVTVTDNWRAVEASPLGEILPVEVTGVENSERVGDLLRQLGGGPGSPTTAPVASAVLREVPGRNTLVLGTIGDEKRPIWVAGSYGLGTVHVLLADPRVTPFTRDIGREDLWRALLWLPPPGADDAWLWEDDYDLFATWRWELGAYGWYFPDYSAYSLPRRRLLAEMDFVAPTAEDFYNQGESHYVLSTAGWFDGNAAFAWEGQVREFLSEIPGVAPLPLSWLVVFSGLYLLFIGPVDYLVLRALNRQPLTWITFPITIAVFSAVALVGTTLVKGNQAVVTRLEVVDVLPGTAGPDGAPIWRGDAYLGIWATRKTRMSVQSGFSDALVQPLQERGTMFDSVVVTTEGSGAMKWRAETWTLAYVRSSWVQEHPGTVWIEPLPSGEGWRIHNDLGVGLASARLMARGVSLDIGAFPNGGHYDLAGTVAPDGGLDLRAVEQAVVRRGVRPTTPSDVLSLDWAIYTLTEHPEAGRGHQDLFGQVALVGATQQPFQPMDLSGINPVTRSATVFRAPLVPATGGSP